MDSGQRDDHLFQDLGGTLKPIFGTKKGGDKVIGILLLLKACLLATFQTKAWTLEGSKEDQTNL